MLDRVDAQLAPLDADTAPRPLARRSGSVLSLPNGDISGELRPLILDRRSGRATYELSVDNDTASAVAAFAYPVTRDQVEERVSWSACTIPPFTSVIVPIEVGLVRNAKTQRVVAELHGPSAHLTIDAALPKAGPHEPGRRAAFAAAAAALALAGIAGFSLLSPHVLALGAPRRAAPEVPFSVAYAFAGARSAEYTVETPGGLQVRRGTLVSHSGSFTVTLPRGQRTYNLRLLAHGMFGDDTRLTQIALAPGSRGYVAAGRPPRLTNVQLKDSSVLGGDEILVGYHANADGGLVQLLDYQNNVRGEALLNPHLGNTALVAPFVDRVQDFRVVVRAERAGRSQVKTIALRVAPAAPAFVPQLHPVAPPRALVAPDLAPDNAPADAAPAYAAPAHVAPIRVPMPVSVHYVKPQRTAAPVVTIVQTPAPVHDPIELAAKTFKSVAPITVTVLRAERALHVALMSTGGDELTGVDVSAHQKSVTIAAPHVARDEQFLIVATYESGNGQETEVRPVTIKAR